MQHKVSSQNSHQQTESVGVCDMDNKILLNDRRRTHHGECAQHKKKVALNMP